MNNKPTIKDSLALCASDLQHSAIYDNHIEMQSCIRAVADRITALASVIDGVGRAALDAPAQPEAWQVNHIADHVADNWPMRKYDLAEIEQRLRGIPAAPQPPAQAQEDVPDMFWDADDTEIFAHEIQDIIDGYGPGEIVTIECAKRLPNFRAVVTRDGDGISYEYLEAALAAQEGGAA